MQCDPSEAPLSSVCIPGLLTFMTSASNVTMNTITFYAISTSSLANYSSAVMLQVYKSYHIFYSCSSACLEISICQINKSAYEIVCSKTHILYYQLVLLLVECIFMQNQSNLHFFCDSKGPVCWIKCNSFLYSV